MRDAISLLDQLASTGQRDHPGDGPGCAGHRHQPGRDRAGRGPVAGQAAPGLDQHPPRLDAGSDPRQFARQVVDYLRSLLLVRMGNAAQVDATAEMRAQMARHAQALQYARAAARDPRLQPRGNRSAQRLAASTAIGNGFCRCVGKPAGRRSSCATPCRNVSRQNSSAARGSSRPLAGSRHLRLCGGSTPTDRSRIRRAA